MKHIFNDGGRADAGYKGRTGDCVVRAIAIAAELPYKKVYTDLHRAGKERLAMGKGLGNPSPRNGVSRKIYQPYLESLGFVWTPTMKIGTGCRVHMIADELPSGRIICRVSRHMVAVIDGVIHDTYEEARRGTRCVYGYFQE